MPKPLRMPSESEVPRGPRRDFLQELFEYYHEAGRPTLDQISAQILVADRAGTASKETIRRALTAGAPPTRWFTAEAIFLALCELAEKDCKSDRWEAERDWRDDSPIQTRLDYFKSLWNKAIDNPPRAKPQPSNDPWGSRSDEPPF